MGARRVISLLMILSLVSWLMLVTAGGAAGKPAGGNNSANAKLCKDWSELYRSDGSTFANKDECVSYGAMGGVILTEPPVPPLPNLVTVNPPSAAAGTYEASGAAFGPTLTTSGVTGALVRANPIDGCSPLSGFPAGSIAMIDRGSCAMVDKVLNAQAAGAVAVVIVNDVSGDPVTIDGSSPFVTIPSVMVSLASGATMYAGLPGVGTVQAKP